MEYTFVIVFVSLVFGVAMCSIDVDKVRVYGPGLNPTKIVMPARYFFVNFKESVKEKDTAEIKNALSVSVTGEHLNQRECRVWVNILDRRDGIFIIRYKMYEPCYNLKISVRYKSIDVDKSPYFTEGLVLPEECYCPQNNFENWLNNYQCLERNYVQIEEDLKLFPSVNFTSIRKEALKKFDHPGSMSICNYVILNNKIYRKCYGDHTGFRMFMDSILLSLSRKAKLPDMEFLVNLGDWPLMKKESGKIFPLFSWCGSEDTHDILMPTYDLTESSLECMGRVSLDMLSVQGNIDKSWCKKENKAFWRGRDSSRERLKLIEIARQNPHLFNASLTNFFFFRDVEHIYGPKEKHISFFKFFDYKYQLNLDGTVAAYRFPYLLVGNSVVFKQESKYYEHFYKDLKDFSHFIPFKKDLSNLVEQIKWATENDSEAKLISENGQKYAEENLLPQHIFCYYAVLINEWSKRLVGKVKVRKNMEQVSQPDQKDCICHKRNKDEL